MVALVIVAFIVMVVVTVITTVVVMIVTMISSTHDGETDKNSNNRDCGASEIIMILKKEYSPIVNSIYVTNLMMTVEPILEIIVLLVTMAMIKKVTVDMIIMISILIVFRKMALMVK